MRLCFQHGITLCSSVLLCRAVWCVRPDLPDKRTDPLFNVTEFSFSYIDIIGRMKCVYIWNVYTYGMCVHMECVDIRNVCTYGMCVQMECMYIWNVCTYGMYVRMECVYVWNVCTYGMCEHMECVYIWNV
jgi:hypothetical protein